MTKHTCKRHQAPVAPEPEGFAAWWAQWPSRTVAAGRRAHYAEAYDARREEIEQLKTENHRLRAAASQASYCLRVLLPDDSDAKFTVRVLCNALDPNARANLTDTAR